VGNKSNAGFGSKFAGEKGKSEMMRYHDATASSFVAKVPGDVFTNFHLVAIKRHLVCGIGCFTCQYESFASSSLNIKENDQHALDFVPHLSNTHVLLMLSSLNTCLIISRVSVSIFLTFAQNLIHIRCSFVRSIKKSHQARYMT
jgi:hypothetical protein